MWSKHLQFKTHIIKSLLMFKKKTNNNKKIKIRRMFKAKLDLSNMYDPQDETCSNFTLRCGWYQNTLSLLKLRISSKAGPDLLWPYMSRFTLPGFTGLKWWMLYSRERKTLCCYWAFQLITRHTTEDLNTHTLTHTNT